MSGNLIAKIFSKEERKIPPGTKANEVGNSNVNNINIVVNGSGSDGKKLAFDIKNVLKKELDRAYYTRAASGV